MTFLYFKRTIFIALICVLACSTSYGQSSNVPDSREAFIKCAVSMQTAIEKITPEDDAKSKGNRPYHKSLVKKMLVNPFEYNGYNFEKSIIAVADATKVIQNRLNRNDIQPDQVDGELAGAIIFMFKALYSSVDHLVQYGFIGPPTKQYMTGVIESLQKK